jgi:hypothetical protein
LCAHEELIRPRSCPFIKQPYRSCLENPLIVVNAVTGISTSGYNKLNSCRLHPAPMPKHHSNHAQVYRCSDILVCIYPALLLLYQIFSTIWYSPQSKRLLIL